MYRSSLADQLKATCCLIDVHGLTEGNQKMGTIVCFIVPWTASHTASTQMPPYSMTGYSIPLHLPWIAHVWSPVVLKIEATNRQQLVSDRKRSLVACWKKLAERFRWNTCNNTTKRSIARRPRSIAWSKQNWTWCVKFEPSQVPTERKCGAWNQT